MKHRRQGNRPGGPPPRRTPPPASTGTEARYLEQLIREATVVRLELSDDERLSGRLTGFTADTLQFEGPDGPRLVRKSDVRMIVESQAG